MAYRCSLLIDSQGQAQLPWRLANSLSDTPAEQCVSCEVTEGSRGLAGALRAFQSGPPDRFEPRLPGAPPPTSLVWIHAPVGPEDGRLVLRCDRRSFAINEIVRDRRCAVVLDGPVDTSDTPSWRAAVSQLQAGDSRVWVARGAHLVPADEVTGAVPDGPCAEAYAVVAVTHALRGQFISSVQGGAENVGYTSSPGNEEEFFVRTRLRTGPGEALADRWTNSAGEELPTGAVPINPCETDLWVLVDSPTLAEASRIYAYGMAWTDSAGDRRERWRAAAADHRVALGAKVYWFGGAGRIVTALNANQDIAGIERWKDRFPHALEYVWSGTGTSTAPLPVGSAPMPPTWKVSTSGTVKLFLAGVGRSQFLEPMADFSRERWYSVEPNLSQITLKENQPVVLELLDGAGTLTVYPAL